MENEPSIDDMQEEAATRHATEMALLKHLALEEKEAAARQAAELALLKHLALEGELSLRRDQLAAEHQAVTQRLAEARGRREALVAAVKETGGELPRWEM